MTSISKIWKQLTYILSNLNNFHSLEVVDRVSETQLQVGENSDWIIWQLKGYFNFKPTLEQPVCLQSKHRASTQCLFQVCPASAALAQL